MSSESPTEATSQTPTPGDPSDEAGEPQGGLGAPSLAAALEALLLVAVEPMESTVLAQVTGTPIPDVEQALGALAADYDAQERGFSLLEVAGGWRYFTRDSCAEVVERYVRDGQQARLTQAALETLAVVAYKQPVSRARISAIRGVNVDGVIRTLLTRGLIEEAGQEEGSQAILYRTTTYFLERLGVASLGDLPPIGPLLPAADDAVELFDSLST